MSYIDPVQFVHDDHRRRVEAGQRYELLHRLPAQQLRTKRRHRLHLPRLARA